MGLINLQTNLKSLRFGNDRFGNGNSGQPYIQTPIPDQLPRSGTEDFILRGGLNAFEDSATDVLRLGKYFTDPRNPDGLLFIAKQNLLSRTAVRTQTSGFLLNEGIYTPLSTLVEAGLVAFGGHVNKQGLNPFDGIGSIRKYSEVVTSNQTIYQNRLIDIYANIELKKTNNVNVFSYGGGPDSFLGIGKTHIRLADQRTGINNPQLRNIGFFDGFSTPLFYPTFNDEGSQTKEYDYSVFSINNSDTSREELEPEISRQLGVSGKDIPEKYKNLNNTYINYSIFNIGNSGTDRSDLTINYNRGLGLSLGVTVSGSNKSLADTTYTGFNLSGQLESSTLGRDLKPSEGTSLPQQRHTTAFTTNGKPISINGNKLLGVSLTRVDAFDARGFTTNGTIDSNVRKVGSLDNPDLTSNQASSNLTLTSDALTFDYKDIITLPESPDSNGGSFVIGATSTAPGVYTTANVGDFRKNLRNKVNDNSIAEINANNTNGATSLAPNYYTKNIQVRVNLGDPGDKYGKNLQSYVNGSNPGQIVGKSGGNASLNSYDIINALPVYLSGSADNDNGNDLVKFRIGVIDNDNPDLKTYIHFRAFLNQISDGYTADWASTQYIGRGEKFYNYTGFDRKVSLSWTVAAQSKAELIPMYKKLNYLASVCAPDYSSQGYMRGNIVTLTIGGYFYEQPGIITGFNYEMNDDNATWEIGINDEGGSDSTVKELPHLIKVSGFNFIPIHTFVPRKQINLYDPAGGILTDMNQYGPERYIALSNGANNNYGDPNPAPPPPPPPQPDPAPTPPPAPPKSVPVGIVDVSGNTAYVATSPDAGRISRLVKDNPVNNGNTGVAGFSEAEVDRRAAIYYNR